MKFSARWARGPVALALAYTCIGATAPNPHLSPRASADVREAFHLLTTVPFKPLSAQHLLDVARHALEARAKERGVVLSLFPATASTPQADVATLDDEIETIAGLTHDAARADAYLAIRAMAAAFHDPYTVFWDPEQMLAFQHELDPKRTVGVGLELRRSHAGLVVAYVVPGTPADRADVRAGDRIPSIDGKSTRDLGSAAAEELFAGKVGTPVSITVARAGEREQTLTLDRALYRPPTVTSRMYPDRIGYVAVSAFGEATPEEFGDALHRLVSAGARGLVFDLRNDGGGFVSSAVEIASDFLGRQPLMVIERRDRAPATIHGENDAPLHLPMIVLVNGNTASASEITAGALQDDRAAEIIGTQTFGKGVMQELDPLRDGAALKITTAHYLTPLHRDINKRGLTPNIRVSGAQVRRIGELSHDPQLQAAMHALLVQLVAHAHAHR
uniref:Putative C-terminal processing peptidase n=1 Tax=mine drainage metagenome TaxID=410659 RepID=E6Q645_9ZZZZ